MTIYTNTGAQFSKAGIAVSYTDETGSAATQNVTFANKTFSVDSGLNVSAGNTYLAGDAQIHAAAQLDSTLDVTGSGRFRNALVVDGAFNMGGALNVVGAAAMGSTLAVTGATNLNNTLAVLGAASMTSTLVVTGAANLNNTIAVAGATSLNSSIAVAGATSMAGAVDVTGAARLRNTLLVDGAATMGSSLAVAGASNLNGVLAVTGASNLNNTLAVAGAASLYSTLAVAGAASLASTLEVTGASNLNNTLAVAGAANLKSSLAVAGVSILTGALDVKAATHLENTLLVDGAASLGAALTVTGAATMNNGMTVNGTSTHNGALVVSGAASVGGALAVTGASNLNSSMNVKGASRLEDVLVVDGAVSLASSLAVAGNSSLVGTLAVAGASTLTGALNVKAASHLENTILVDGAASLGSSLTVTGASILNNTMNVSGAASLASMLAVIGAATLSSSLDVAGAANVVGAMDVTGASRLRNSAQIDGAASIGSTLAVTGAANLSNSLAVAGVASMASTLDVTGASRLRNNIMVDGTASMGSTLAVTGAASMASTLAVTGAANLNNTLAVTGAASLNNSLAVAGAATLSSSLAVTGAANLNNTLAVTGAVNLNNTLAVSNAASMASTLAVTGAASMANTLAVTGAATFQNNVTVNGNLTVLGSQTAIDTTSLQVKDNAILLADGNEADILPTGIQLQYKPSGAAAVKYAGVKRMPTTGEFVFFKDAVDKIDKIAEPSTGGSVSTPTIPYLGEYATVDVGSSVQISEYALSEYSTLIDLIQWSLVGSNDKLSWYLIDSKDGQKLPNYQPARQFSVSTKAYRYYRLIIQKYHSNEVYYYRFGFAMKNMNGNFLTGTQSGYSPSWVSKEPYGTSYISFVLNTTYNIGSGGPSVEGGYEMVAENNALFSGPGYTYTGTVVTNITVEVNIGVTHLVAARGYAIRANYSSPIAVSSYAFLGRGSGKSYQKIYIYGAVNANDTTVRLVHYQNGNSSSVINVNGDSTTAFSTLYFVINTVTPGDTSPNINFSEIYVNSSGSRVNPSSVDLLGSLGNVTLGTGVTISPITMFTTNGSYYFEMSPEYNSTGSFYNNGLSIVTTTTSIANVPVPVVLTDVYAVVMADSFNSASDARLKKDVATLEGALDKIDAIRGVHYHWVDAAQPQSRQVGVIAQEIQAVYPELIMEGGNGYLSVDYPKLNAVLIQSVKELKALILSLSK